MMALLLSSTGFSFSDTVLTGSDPFTLLLLLTTLLSDSTGNQIKSTLTILRVVIINSTFQK